MGILGKGGREGIINGKGEQLREKMKGNFWLGMEEAGVLGAGVYDNVCGIGGGVKGGRKRAFRVRVDTCWDLPQPGSFSICGENLFSNLSIFVQLHL